MIPHHGDRLIDLALREAAFLASRILVMSARPGRVAEDRNVEFNRPRTLETTFEPAFATLTNDLRRLIFAARESQRVYLVILFRRIRQEEKALRGRFEAY